MSDKNNITKGVMSIVQCNYVNIACINGGILVYRVSFIAIKSSIKTIADIKQAAARAGGEITEKVTLKCLLFGGYILVANNLAADLKNDFAF